MFKDVYIDSLKLRIDEDSVKILDDRFIMPYVKFYPHKDLIDDDLNPCEPFTMIQDGITYRYYFKTYPNKVGYLKKYLVLQISAKMAKAEYFNGITLKNIENILNDINAQNIVLLSKNAFLNALVSDIDICINQLIDIKSYDFALNLLHQNALASCKPLINPFKTKVNNNLVHTGLDFNKREKATNTRPYIKIYHKGIELQSKSAIFYNKFIQPLREVALQNLVRYEFTIKAYDHKKYLIEKGLLTNELKTLNDLFKISQKELRSIILSGLPHYIQKPKEIKSFKEFNPMDSLLAHFMQELIYKGHDEDDLKKFLYTIECPTTKSRMKTKINSILKHLQLDNQPLKNQLKSNEKANKFLSFLGL